jgi:hypothetical protein
MNRPPHLALSHWERVPGGRVRENCPAHRFMVPKRVHGTWQLSMNRPSVPLISNELRKPGSWPLGAPIRLASKLPMNGQGVKRFRVIRFMGFLILLSILLPWRK